MLQQTGRAVGAPDLQLLPCGIWRIFADFPFEGCNVVACARDEEGQGRGKEEGGREEGRGLCLLGLAAAVTRLSHEPFAH